MIAGVGLTVGAGVAVAGIIGFVGLIVPHLVRPFTDRRPSSLLLPSALAGALLLLVADCLCRMLPLAGGELRLGIALSLRRRAVLPAPAAADARRGGLGMTLAAHDLPSPAASPASPPTCAPAKSPRSAAPTAPASRACSPASPACSRPTAAR